EERLVSAQYQGSEAGFAAPRAQDDKRDSTATDAALPLARRLPVQTPEGASIEDVPARTGSPTALKLTVNARAPDSPPRPRLASPVISFVRLGAMLTSVPVISPAFRAVAAVLATAPTASLGYLLAFARAAARESAASPGRDARTRSNGVRARDVTAEQLPDTR